MIKTLQTAPTTEPLSIADIKEHLRIDDSVTDHNTELAALIIVARKYVEEVTRRGLITQTWDYWLDRFPFGDREIELPRSPVSSVDSITYVDENGTEQTWASSNYTVDTDSEPGRIYLAYNKRWPAIRSQRKAVKIRFVAGYGDAVDVPDDVIHAMKLHCELLFDKPDEKYAKTLEDTRDALLSMHRVVTL